MAVQEVKPGNAVSIIECDMNVEFDAPVGYQEPQKPAQKQNTDDETPMDLGNIAIPNNRFIVKFLVENSHKGEKISEIPLG